MVWKSNPQGYDVFEFRIMDDLYSIYHDLKEMGWPLDNDDFMGIGDPEIANIKGQMQEVWLLYNFLLKDEKERIYKAFPNTIEWLVLNWPHFESLKKAKKAQKEIREFRKKGDDSGAWLQYLNLLGNQNYLLPQLALASNPPEHIGFCADKEGKVQALYKIGDKYYRKNPAKVKQYLLAIRGKTGKNIIQSYPSEEARDLMISLLDMDDYPFTWATSETIDYPGTYPPKELDEVL